MSKGIHPIDGFREDFDKFYKDFLAAKSLRFRVFAEVWQKYSFSFLLCGRETQAKTADLLNCLFYQLIDFIQPPHEVETQVCALYMLYGFYFKQPIKGLVRIRVTSKEWATILQFQAAMRREAHWDTVYVFHSLCSAKAFHFCATRQPYFPHVPVYACINNESVSYSEGKPLSAILGIDRIQMLKDIHQRYQDFKRALPSQKQAAAEASASGDESYGGLTADLNLVRPDFFDYVLEKVNSDDSKLKSLCKDYNNFKVAQNVKSEKDGMEDDSDEEDDFLEDSDGIEDGDNENDSEEDSDIDENDDNDGTNDMVDTTDGDKDGTNTNSKIDEAKKSTEATNKKKVEIERRTQVESGSSNSDTQPRVEVISVYPQLIDKPVLWGAQRRRFRGNQYRKVDEPDVPQDALKDQDLSELSIGERRRLLKERPYGKSPLKASPRTKRSKIKSKDS